jgi:hypothetical protein
MSKHFRPWKIDETHLLPHVQDYVAEDHLSRLIVSLVRESLDLSEIAGSYTSGLGQPPFDPQMMTGCFCILTRAACIRRGGSPGRRSRCGGRVPGGGSRSSCARPTASGPFGHPLNW